MSSSSEHADLPGDTVICLASESLFERCDGKRLTSLLGERGIRLEPIRGQARQPEAVSAVILDAVDHGTDAPLAAWARRHGRPVVTLSRSRSGRGWRLGEWTDETAWGTDLRLKRLVDRFGRKLDPEAVAAFADGRPAPTSGWRRSGGFARSGSILAIDPELAAPWQTALASSALAQLATSLGIRLTGDTKAPGSALLADGGSFSAWEAVAQGRELVCVASCPFSNLRVTHDAPTAEDLPAALVSLAAERRNRRDAARLVLATERAFNTIPDDPVSISAALDGAIRAIGSRPRQSVTIIITCYNYAAYVGEAIASALDQSVPAHQIIVVDDGSTDGSIDVIRAASGIDVVCKENGGQASAFNAGFARATGDLVLFLDADDRLLPDAVEMLGSVDTRGLARVQFGLETIDADGRSTGSYPMSRRAANGYLPGPLISEGIFSFMPTSGNVFPRQRLQSVFPVPEKNWRICADLFLVLACALQGETAEVASVLGQYRVHGRNGYFSTLAAEPYLDEPKRAQHRRAWRDVSAKLRRFPDPLRADRFRLALHRLTVTTMTSRSPLGVLAEAARGLCLATSAHALPPGERARHAVSTVRRLFSARDAKWRAELGKGPPIDFIEWAGRTTWPSLGPSDASDMLTAMASQGLFGGGWSEPNASGVCLNTADGFMGFRLPRVDSHWRLKLDFTVVGPEPVRGIKICLNGVLIDRLDLSVGGVIDLRLPAELLFEWSQLTGVQGDLAACVSFHVAEGDVGRLHVLPVGLDVLPGLPAAAPLLRGGQLLRIGLLPGADGVVEEPFAADLCLGDGWEWPDERGAELAADSGRLYLSVPSYGSNALTFLLDADPGADLIECLQLTVNGVLVAHDAAPDHRSFTVELTPEMRGTDGRLSIELAVFTELGTGTWPLVRLCGLRLDRLDNALGIPQIVPSIPLEAAAILAGHPMAGDGLARDGKDARILGDSFRLQIGLPALEEPASLRLRIVSETTVAHPVAARLTIGGQSLDFWLGRDNLLPVALPGGAARTLLLEGHIEGNDRRYALRSLQLSMAPARIDPAPRSDASDPIAATALHGFVEDPLAWHRPVDGVMWLAAHEASLALPPLPLDIHSLDVTVLTIGEPAQRMSVTIGSSRVSTTKAGLQVIRVKLPRGSAGRGLRLVVSCDLLISADAMGATGPRMLGGGVCQIAPVAKEPPATRVASSAGSMPRSKSLRQTESLP